MTSPTGSNAVRSSVSPLGRRPRGLTFIEVMVTAVVLSVGLVAIYRAFFIGLDQLNHLSYRLYALNLLEQKIAVVEKDFRSLKDFDIGPLAETVVINNHPVDFQYAITLVPVENLLSVFRLDIGLSWSEKGRSVSVARSAYFSGVSSTGTGQ